MMNRNSQQAQNIGLRQSIGKGNLKTPQSSSGKGVFLEFNPKKYTNKHLKESDIVSMKQVFDYYDSEDAGMLSPNDLK